MSPTRFDRHPFGGGHHVFKDDRSRWHPRTTLLVILGSGLAAWVLISWGLSAAL